MLTYAEVQARPQTLRAADGIYYYFYYCIYIYHYFYNCMYIVWPSSAQAPSRKRLRAGIYLMKPELDEGGIIYLA